MLCLKDFEEYASKQLPPKTCAFYSMGAERERTLAENLSSYQRYNFIPRVLHGIDKPDLGTTVLGSKVSFPIGLAPTAFQRMAHPDGEIAAAKAAASMNTIYTLSTVSNTSVTDVALEVPNSLRWLQVYVLKNRAVTAKMIREAEINGFKALVLTVDVPKLGLQLRTRRLGFSVPRHLKVPNVEAAYDESMKGRELNHQTHIDSLFAHTLTWADVLWLKNISRLPIVLKGILTAEDARLAVKHGVSAVWVSNHGGRQLDGTLPGIDALEEIVKAVDGTNCEVYVDGGIRWGSDVLKALALGARMVFIGRPLIWGLAHSGEDGVKRVLEILKEELSLAMTLVGCQNVSEVNSSILKKSNISKL